MTGQFSGHREKAAKKRGLCVHGWIKGDGDPSNPGGEVTCLDCGKVAAWDELMTERSNLM